MVVKEGLKGIIYVEALKQTHVAAAIEGISALNSYQVTMVPIKEMCDTLKVVKDIPTLKNGMYVRMKRTMYKDDLAQVSVSIKRCENALDFWVFSMNLLAFISVLK